MLYHDATPDLAREQILFLHIRKTAGTSLARVMMKGLGAHAPDLAQFGGADRHAGALLSLHGRVRRAAVNAGRRGGVALKRLRGAPVHRLDDQPFHAGHYLLDEAPPCARPRHWITVLRDPAERFLSDYHHMREKRDRGRADCMEARLYDLDLPDFVAALEARPEVYQHDYQCRQLARRAPDAEAAMRAVDERLWLAATTPQLPAFLDKAGAALGVRFDPIPSLRRNEARPRLADLPEALAARIRAFNPGDARLVAHTAAAFEAL